MPLLIKLPYTAAALKQARVTDTAELKVFYYDPALLAWIEVAVDSVDPVNRTVSIQTNHFSMYTIAAPVAAAAGGSGGAACFISTVTTTVAAFVVPDWSISGIFGLLAFVGLLWLGRGREEGENLEVGSRNRKSGKKEGKDGREQSEQKKKERRKRKRTEKRR